jgi:hypothetical protein
MHSGPRNHAVLGLNRAPLCEKPTPEERWRIAASRRPSGAGASRPPQSRHLLFRKLLKDKDLLPAGQSLESGILKRNFGHRET